MKCQFCDKGVAEYHCNLELGIEVVMCSDCLIVFKRVFNKRSLR